MFSTHSMKYIYLIFTSNILYVPLRPTNIIDSHAMKKLGRQVLYFNLHFFKIKRGHHFISFSDKTINTKHRLLQIITFEPYMKHLTYPLRRRGLYKRFLGTKIRYLQSSAAFPPRQHDHRVAVIFEVSMVYFCTRCRNCT